MNINGTTRVIGLIGNPVEHTLSPVIHNGISERMGISSVYAPFKVTEQGVGDAVKGAYELNILGMNVTVPHKNRVMEQIVEIDDAAKHIGAVNTLVRVDKKHGYKGYNTDMLGLRRQITEDGVDLKGRTVVILGAGGAAKAVVYMCLLEGAATVYILNRTLEKAEVIAKHMEELIEAGVFSKQHDEEQSRRVIPMKMSDYSDILEHELVVFQATSIGLSPNVNQVVIDDAAFYKKIAIGVDLIYNPADTKFMQLVRKQGGTAYNALKMLLYQAVIAYELWHDITVSQEIIEEVYLDLKRKVYPKDNIVLIGFMGSGKTTFGRKLARQYGMDFIDTDEYIEKQEGLTIAQIFEQRGEEAFRQLETETLRHLRDTVKHTVFATGGGMPLRRENAMLLKEIGAVVYLNAASSVIYERVKGDKRRPLLQGENPYGTICNLMRQRRPLYRKAADVIIDANVDDIEEIMNELKKQFVIQ